jgi:hypothetical protein
MCFFRIPGSPGSFVSPRRASETSHELSRFRPKDSICLSSQSDAGARSAAIGLKYPESSKPPGYHGGDKEDWALGSPNSGCHGSHGMDWKMNRQGESDLSRRVPEEKPAARGVAQWAREEMGFEPDWVQARVLESETRQGVLNCCRQWGKSTVTAVKAVHEAWTREGSLTVVVSPSSGSYPEIASDPGKKLRVHTRPGTGRAGCRKGKAGSWRGRLRSCPRWAAIPPQLARARRGVHKA